MSRYFASRSPDCVLSLTSHNNATSLACVAGLHDTYTIRGMPRLRRIATSVTSIPERAGSTITTSGRTTSLPKTMLLLILLLSAHSMDSESCAKSACQKVAFSILWPQRFVSRLQRLRGQFRNRKHGELWTLSKGRRSRHHKINRGLSPYFPQ